VEIIARSPIAHYSDDHREFDGILLPVKRMAYQRDESGQRVPDPVIVTIDLDDITLD
jgi:hypothetical protein